MAPEQYDLIVLGGGPAGSSAAAIAARDGLSVLLLEANAHPRTHVGESLLPGITPILAEMGALDAVEAAGFTRKTGSTHHGWGRTPRWDLWFSESEAYDHAWLVDRARFDALLFEAARSAGAKSLENAAARRLLFEGDRLTGVQWRIGQEKLQTAVAPWVVDASGGAMLVARELGLRESIEGLQHLAGWAHFEDAGVLPAPREGQAWFLAEAGHWIWMFALGGGRASVGIITLDGRRLDFDEVVAANTELSATLGPRARRCTPIRWERDWSYRMSAVAGPGWLLTGDAAGFIDPVLSTGVMLAMHGGWAAARVASRSLRAESSEAELVAEYQQTHDGMFTDLLRIVRFFYQQNLDKEDYFWESKKILVRDDNEIKPQRAFVVLTSGLVGNLAFDDRRERVTAERQTRVESGAPTLEEPPPELRFVCLHLRYHGVEPAAALYVVIEPADPADPTLFRTAHLHLNCLAPRYGNDPITDPTLAPMLRGLHDCLREVDDRPDETLAALWQRARQPIASYLGTLPEAFELVRVFGQ